VTGLRTGQWPGFVARVATPALPSETISDVAEGYEVTIGGEAPGGVVLAVSTQILLETGTREDPNHDGVTTREEQAPGYWNGNGGNIRGTYGAGWWTSFTAGEGHGASAVTLQPGPNNRFRSYVGPNEDPTNPEVQRRARRLGIDDMLSLLARKYSKALERAAARDYHGYVQALHDGGYFTADTGAYDRAEERLRHTIENLPQLAAFLHEAHT